MGFLRKYLFPALRRIIFPILFGVVFFNLFKHRLPKFKVLSPLETIDLLKKEDKLSLGKLFKNPRAKPDGTKMFCSAFLNDARMCCFFANAIVKY